MSNFFGYVSLVAGQKASADVGSSGLSGLLIGNESGLTVVVELQNANSKRSLYPGTVDFFEVPKGTPFNGNVIFTNDAKLNNIATWPASFLQIDTFGPGEKPSGVYPMTLTRNANVGNEVNTIGGTANAVANDNNASGTSVVEATVTGDGASAVDLTNDAFFSLGTAAHPARVQIVCSLGTITIDSNGKLTVPDQIVANLITALAGNDVGLHAATGQRVVSTINGVDTFAVNGSGADLIAGKLQLPNDGTAHISGISHFSGPVNLGATVFNHNLGATPDVVLVSWNLTGNPTQGHTLAVDMTTATATQITVRSDVANSGNGIVGVAIKF